MLHFLNDLLSLKATLHSQPPCSSHFQYSVFHGVVPQARKFHLSSVCHSYLPTYQWCQSSTPSGQQQTSFEAFSRLSRPCKTDSSKGPREIRALFMVKQSLRQVDIYENARPCLPQMELLPNFMLMCSSSTVFPRFGHKSFM